MVIFIALTGIAIVALMIGFFGIRLPFIGAETEGNLPGRKLNEGNQKGSKGRVKIINRVLDIPVEHKQIEKKI